MFQEFLRHLAGAGMQVMQLHLCPTEVHCTFGLSQDLTAGSLYTEKRIVSCQTSVCLGGIQRKKEK